MTPTREQDHAVSGGAADETALRRGFFIGWIVLALAAGFLPLAATQVEMAKTYGSRGVIGTYFRREHSLADLVRVDSGLSFGVRYPPILSWHEYRVWWAGELFLPVDGNYRLAFQSGPASFLSLSLPGKDVTVVSRRRTNPTRVQTKSMFLTRGWHLIHVSRWSSGDVPLVALVSLNGEPFAPVPPGSFRIPAAGAERARRFLRSKGGNDAVARFLWRLMKGKSP